MMKPGVPGSVTDSASLRQEDDALPADFPHGVELEVFVRRKDAEKFIEPVRGDEPELGRCRVSRSGAGGGRLSPQTKGDPCGRATR